MLDEQRQVQVVTAIEGMCQDIATSVKHALNDMTMSVRDLRNNLEAEGVDVKRASLSTMHHLRVEVTETFEKLREIMGTGTIELTEKVGSYEQSVKVEQPDAG